MLTTDNKALSYMFKPNASIPPLAASRLVRWTLILANYDFDILFKQTKDHYNADMLSRLPLPQGKDDYSINAINILQINNMPISPDEMRNATLGDTLLSQVVKFLSSDDWPHMNRLEHNIKPYFHKRNELSLQDGIVMFGLRVVIPDVYRGRILSELHKGHPGITRMKGLSRIHVWYPGIDADIETTVKSCYECAKNKNKPPKTFIHPWNWPTHAFDRVHVDFFQLNGKDYLLLADSFSKWIEIECLNRTKSRDSIRVLRQWFSRFGVPIQLVSDNGPQFVSHEFSTFVLMNGIKHIRSSAYHPCSNGGAERFVQTVKQGLRASHIEIGDCDKKLHNFLFSYRITPSSVTGKSPCELFLGRQVRSRLNMMKPNIPATDITCTPLQIKLDNYTEKMKQRIHGRKNVRVFFPKQDVLVANHIGKQKWLFGTIVKRIADRTYIVNIRGRHCKRHIDDIIPRLCNKADNPDDDSWVYEYPSSDGMPNTRNQSLPRNLRRYPTRNRRPVDRYGISNFV